MLKFDHISYSYNRHSKALADICATIAPGICLLLGPNGAGKTTLLSITAGERFAKKGTVDFDGYNPALRLPDDMSRIFFLHDDYVSPFRSVKAMVKYMAPFYPNFNAETLRQNLEAFGLKGTENLRGISLGMRRKSLLAFALALGVELLMLDEPANGLDINSKKEFRRMMSRCISDEQTVLISTHTVADLEMLYDSVLVLGAGRMLLSASTEQISAKLSFVSSPTEIPDALFCEREGAQYNAIIEAGTPYSTAVNFEQLYSGLMSPAADAIINLIMQD